MADETKNETVSDLADLKDIAADAPQGDAAEIAAVADVPLREQELDQYGRAYATGRRKDAVARVWLKPGTGKITVNGRDQEVYFARPTLRLIINQPFAITRMACPGAMAGQEEKVLEALKGTAALAYDPVSDRMQLIPESGASVLGFAREVE